MSPDALRRWLIERVAAYLGLPPADIDPTVKLRTYGLDSVHALGLCVDVEETVGVLVEPTMPWDHPTIDDMTAHLADLLPEDRTVQAPPDPE
ncbi:acyl carrier protein [Microbispora sp. SCL1-1]|jgi:acyl carrier protein|nr:acyl carrier protein [Microbispora sp. CL1-1]TQS12504.1 acyl carrier protein [Microbispora sp. SCL1-1]